MTNEGKNKQKSHAKQVDNDVMWYKATSTNKRENPCNGYNRCFEFKSKRPMKFHYKTKNSY